MALAAYRHLLRSIDIAFKGDARMLQGARIEAHRRFAANRGMDGNSAEYRDAVNEARDVAVILRQNVVQGAASHEQTDSDTFKLRIHEHTERGDNESIKIAGKKFKEMEQRPAKGHSA